MTNRHRKQWESLGTSDPYWAVLTDPRKKNGGWDKTEFFQTGLDEIDSLLKKIRDQGIQLKFGLALDYGCGVGRLSRALSNSFQRVIGVDISDAMLLEARSANSDFSNIQFLRNNGDSLEGIDDNSVDFIYSNIALQHAPRKNQCLLIREFCRALRPGAALVFQTPSHHNALAVNGLLHLLLGNRVLNIIRRIKYGKGHVMELHTISKDLVLNILREEGMSVLEAERYDVAGIAYISYRYFAIKELTN